MSKSLPRCSMLCKDDTRCGRRVSDGSNPPVCHVHAAVAAGEALGALTEPVIDEMKILKRLTSDASPQVRLRAVEFLLNWQHKQRNCPACAARSERNEELAERVAAASDEDKGRARTLIHELHEIFPPARPGAGNAALIAGR